MRHDIKFVKWFIHTSEEIRSIWKYLGLNTSEGCEVADRIGCENMVIGVPDLGKVIFVAVAEIVVVVDYIDAYGFLDLCITDFRFHSDSMGYQKPHSHSHSHSHDIVEMMAVFDMG